MNYPCRRGELIQSANNESWAIYEPTSDSLHALNESALAIWELCDGQTSPEEMAGAISELTGLSVEEAQNDVDATLETLSSYGLVRH